MPNEERSRRPHERWAQFRFGVIGGLLAAPPKRGSLKCALARLAATEWRHPTSGVPVRFTVPTIERWYYRALNESRDPVAALRRRTRKDSGTQRSVGELVGTALRQQYEQHKSWSYQLHADNLAVLVAENPRWRAMPSYDSIVRYMKAHAMVKRPRRGPPDRPGVKVAEERFDNREIRSYESDHVNALWHLDFHSGSLKVLMPAGWTTVQLLGILDDHSRLACHAQWYLAETAENLAHGLSQAFQKRRLPRALMTDGGSAMIAAETQEGLARLGILHEKTLPYSPYQNGKQEVFWAQVEGRLLAMLEGVTDLSLTALNEATLAWIEMEYNRRTHAETGQKPIDRFVAGNDVGRPCPPSEELRLAFTTEVSRSQRRSDGTISIEGTRFEIPSRYGHLERIWVRYTCWDLAHVYLCDQRSGQVLCRIYPQDKSANAAAERRPRDRHVGDLVPADAPQPGMAPLLRKLMRQYAATGLPPAYLPKDDSLHDGTSA